MRRFITDIIFIILSITFMIYLFMVYFADFDSLSYGLLYIFIISLHITFIILYLCFILSEENLKVYDNFISEDNQANIETIVNHFNQNKTNYSIALLGKWGCGKTYLWEHFIRPKIAIKYELITTNLAKSMAIVCGLFLLACLNDDLIKLIRTYFCVSYFDFFKPIFLFPILLGLFIYIRIFSSYKNSIIYISLYGKNDFKSAIDEIYQKSQDSKDYLIRLLNGLSSKITGIENLFYKLDEDGFENKIICIDDIERRPKSMELEDVFGLVSHLKEIKKCHVLAIFGEGTKTQENDEGEIDKFKNHKFAEKTFTKIIQIESNMAIVKKLMECSEIKLGKNTIDELYKVILDTDEYKKEGDDKATNIRKFKEIFNTFEEYCKKLKLMHFDDYLGFDRYYLNCVYESKGEFANIEVSLNNLLINNNFNKRMGFKNLYNKFIFFYELYIDNQNLDKFYQILEKNYKDLIDSKKLGYITFDYKIDIFHAFLLSKLFYEFNYSCAKEDYFKKTLEDIPNYIISELPNLENFIKLLQEYNFIKNAKYNKEATQYIKEVILDSDEVYFDKIRLKDLYELILQDKTQVFNVKNFYFKISLELLLALLLDFDTQDDEDNTKVISRLKEILGISSIK